MPDQQSLKGYNQARENQHQKSELMKRAILKMVTGVWQCRMLPKQRENGCKIKSKGPGSPIPAPAQVWVKQLGANPPPVNCYYCQHRQRESLHSEIAPFPSPFPPCPNSKGLISAPLLISAIGRGGIGQELGRNCRNSQQE